VTTCCSECVQFGRVLLEVSRLPRSCAVHTLSGSRHVALGVYARPGVKLDTHIKVQRRVLTASGHRFLLLLLCTSVSLKVCEDMHYAGDCHLRPAVDWTFVKL
jgi:hypothetical protein